jgi:hypothetical protein
MFQLVPRKIVQNLGIKGQGEASAQFLGHPSEPFLSERGDCGSSDQRSRRTSDQKAPAITASTTQVNSSMRSMPKIVLYWPSQ